MKKDEIIKTILQRDKMKNKQDIQDKLDRVNNMLKMLSNNKSDKRKVARAITTKNLLNYKKRLIGLLGGV